jgi:hypothetical protein
MGSSILEVVEIEPRILLRHVVLLTVVLPTRTNLDSLPADT